MIDDEAWWMSERISCVVDKLAAEDLHWSEFETETVEAQQESWEGNSLNESKEDQATVVEMQMVLMLLML